MTLRSRSPSRDWRGTAQILPDVVNESAPSYGGYRLVMTTTPNEPVTNPQVVPSGDPAVQPSQDPDTPPPPGPGPDAMPEWDPDQSPPDLT
jgi:hypothetical protein